MCADPHRPAMVIALEPARLLCEGCQIRKMTIGLRLRLSGYLVAWAKAVAALVF